MADESSPPDPVDWLTTARVARAVARRDHLADSYLYDSLTTDFAAVTIEAEELVAEFTGLRASNAARGAVVDRGQWIDANVESMQRMLAPFTARVGERLTRGPVGSVGRRIAGTEMGMLLGYMSQRVLGQYDLLVPEETPAPTDPTGDGTETTGDAVYYVGPNVLTIEKRFAFRPLEFRRWIAIHEVTHRAQFMGVPWLREYFLSLVEETLGLVDPDPRSLVRAAARAAESLSRGRNPFEEAGIVGLFATDRQRELLARIQALMSLLEGHGNYVMNALGARHVRGVERMERVLQQRRQVGGITGQINKMLGLEMKLRQYDVGERFIRAVVRDAGLHAIDAAWQGPEWIPTLAEFDDPAAWLHRTGGLRPDAAYSIAR